MQFDVQSFAAQNWIQELRSSLTTPEQLHGAGFLSLEESQSPRMRDLMRENQVRITPHYASLIDPHDPLCPIRLQAIPSLPLELDPELPQWLQNLSQDIYGTPSPWRDDAIGDLARLAAPRLTHRYGNRALLHASDNCAVWCRFCFRKSHLNDREESLYSGRFDEAISYITRTTELSEIILTGGDPLSLGDEPLARLLDRLNGITHVKTVRIHTRMPVTLPSRVTPALAAVLGAKRSYHLSLSSHFNHPRELCPPSLHALQLLRQAGITLLNQCVLLRGVNDSSATLATLFQGLYEAGVIPFWLHHPDWTPATFGFRVSIQDGLRIYRDLFGRISGPALPHYVLDLPSGLGKAPLNDARVRLTHSETRDGYHASVYEIPRPNVLESHGPETTRYLDITQT